MINHNPPCYNAPHGYHARKWHWTTKHAAWLHLKKPLQPSQVMALKWNPVALSPQTPQIRGALRSISSVHCADVLTAMASITERKGEKKKKKTKKILERENDSPLLNSQFRLVRTVTFFYITALGLLCNCYLEHTE